MEFIMLGSCFSLVYWSNKVWELLLSLCEHFVPFSTAWKSSTCTNQRNGLFRHEILHMFLCTGAAKVSSMIAVHLLTPSIKYLSLLLETAKRVHADMSG